MSKIMQNPIVFTSSPWEGSTTHRALQLALEGYQYDLVDLTSKNFTDFDPLKRNHGDDFFEIAEQMIHHSTLILACPVYWYGPPALMKRFIDRWSDLLEGRKDIGRKLENKNLLVIAPYGNYPEGKEGFEWPIKGTAEYMSMFYKGCFFYYTGEDPEGLAENQPRLDAFRQILAG